MSSIPEDLYLEILLRSPVKSVLKCKSVSKSWYSLICNPSFVKKHHDFILQTKNSSSRCSSILLRDNKNIIHFKAPDSLQSYEEHTDFEIVDYPFKSLGFSVGLVGSCNGLVCLMFYDDKAIKFSCIWNPATRELKMIHMSPRIVYYNRIRLYAFGYDHKIEDYKLLVLTKGHELFVNTFGLNQWKCARTYRWSWKSPLNGILVNGNHHWLVIRFDQWTIMYLCITYERFWNIEIPKELRDYESITLEVLEECLCLLAEVKEKEVNIEVWVMQDYRVRESWTRRYVITNETITRELVTSCFEIMWDFKNGRVMFMDVGKLILYDPNDGGVSEINLSSLGRHTSAKKYFESLVSPNFGRRGQIEEENLQVHGMYDEL